MCEFANFVVTNKKLIKKHKKQQKCFFKIIDIALEPKKSSFEFVFLLAQEKENLKKYQKMQKIIIDFKKLSFC